MPEKQTNMDKAKKEGRYRRLYRQIKELIDKSNNNRLSNMATIIAVLHHKMEYFFRTGFYLLQDGKLQVGPYQGSLACINLEKDTGVCRAAVNNKKPVVVDDVEKFPGHIACNSRSKSEIVIPLKNDNDEIYGVLDVDSKVTGSFDETDVEWLVQITGLI